MSDSSDSSSKPCLSVFSGGTSSSLGGGIISPSSSSTISPSSVIFSRFLLLYLNEISTSSGSPYGSGWYSISSEPVSSGSSSYSSSSYSSTICFSAFSAFARETAPEILSLHFPVNAAHFLTKLTTENEKSILAITIVATPSTINVASLSIRLCKRKLIPPPIIPPLRMAGLYDHKKLTASIKPSFPEFAKSVYALVKVWIRAEQHITNNERLIIFFTERTFCSRPRSTLTDITTTVIRTKTDIMPPKKPSKML